MRKLIKAVKLGAFFIMVTRREETLMHNHEQVEEIFIKIMAPKLL